MEKPKPTTQPERPDGRRNLYYVAGRHGGRIAEYPWHEEFRLFTLFPDLKRVVRATITNYPGHPHFFPKMTVQEDPFWNGERWQYCWDDPKPFASISVEHWGFFEDDLALYGLGTAEEILEKEERLKEEVALPANRHYVEGSDLYFRKDPIDHAYHSGADAHRWIERAFELLFALTGRFKLWMDYTQSQRRKYDPRLRPAGD